MKVFKIASIPGDGIGKRCLQLAELRIRLLHRDVEPLDNRDRPHIPKSVDNLVRGPGPEGSDVEESDADEA